MGTPLLALRQCIDYPYFRSSNILRRYSSFISQCWDLIVHYITASFPPSIISLLIIFLNSCLVSTWLPVTIPLFPFSFKVRKCEIFDLFDFNDFYVMKCLQVWDFGGEITNFFKLGQICIILSLLAYVCAVGSSDFDIFLEIQHASCVFGLALKS